MSLNDWILALHLLSAFAYVAATIMFWVMVAAAWGCERPSEVLAVFRLNPVATVSVAIGGLGTITFGIWLAISLPAYHPWDGWVIAAIVLWAIAGGAGQRAGTEFDKARTRAQELTGQSDEPSSELAGLVRSRRGLLLHGASTTAMVLILIDMIWKPGA